MLNSEPSKKKDADMPTGGSHEKLADKAKRFRQALSDSAVGPLLVSIEVMKIAQHWDEYQVEAGAKTCTEWLRRDVHPGNSLGYYKGRALAVETFGKGTALRMEHSAALWAVNNVPAPNHGELGAAVSQKFREQHMYVTKSQIVGLAREILGLVPNPQKVKTCKSCLVLEARIGRLEKQIEGLGAKPVK